MATQDSNGVVTFRTANSGALGVKTSARLIFDSRKLLMLPKWGAQEDLPLAWTVDTKDDVRDTIAGRIRSGSQPVLITSPEAIARARVGEALADAAQAELLGWFGISVELI